MTTSWDDGYGIFLVDSDGTELRRLETGGQPALYPVFPPDGSRIAFTSGRDRNRDVYVMEVDGGERVRVTDHEAADGYPSWSPDGTRLASHRIIQAGGPALLPVGVVQPRSSPC